MHFPCTKSLFVHYTFPIHQVTIRTLSFIRGMIDFNWCDINFVTVRSTMRNADVKFIVLRIRKAVCLLFSVSSQPKKKTIKRQVSAYTKISQEYTRGQMSSVYDWYSLTIYYCMCADLVAYLYTAGPCYCQLHRLVRALI